MAAAKYASSVYWELGFSDGEKRAESVGVWLCSPFSHRLFVELKMMLYLNTPQYASSVSRKDERTK